MKKLLTLFLLSALGISLCAADKYDKILDKMSSRSDGMFTVILSDSKVYFAVPDSLLGREFLFGSTIKSISDNANGIVGAKSTSPLRHITFTKRDSTLLMREVESFYLSYDPQIGGAISKSNIGPIVKAFKRSAVSPEGSELFDVTSLFLEHDKKASPFLEIAAYAGYKRNESFKKDLSFVNAVNAFSDNVSVTSTMSYTYTMTGRGGKTLVKDQPLTAVLTRSLLLLPEEVYTPRAGDYRIGFFHTEREQLGNSLESSKTVYLTNRWRLEPRDTAAFLAGELVEPVKPIVFYIDSAFPDWWKPYIHEAVEQWNEPFERAGFKNAIVAKDFPGKEEDPEFDPDNIKYSCIRYAPIGIQNAMGPSWVDPRSGEIINASVYVYHDVIKLLSRWMFVQTAQLDTAVRHSYIPKEVLGDGLRYVLAHEVGHCLGLMHNMSASSVIPVDSLRSPSYTQKYGTTTSIMDYARFNYVAQPSDKGVKLTPPRFGLYDYYAIEWGYKPIIGVEGFDAQRQISSSWITDSLKLGGYYRYGKQQLHFSLYDARNQAEDLGDDVVKATEYGVANLKYIMSNFMEWAGDDDDEYEVRTGYYQGILNQYLTYAQHVLLNVGGLYKNDVKSVDNTPAFQNIPRERQLECLDYMFKMENDLDWVAPAGVTDRLPVVGSPKRQMEKAIQDLILLTPFFASRSDGVVTKELSSAELFDILYNRIWVEAKGKLTPTERDFQKNYVSTLMKSAGFKKAGSSEASISDSGFNSICPEISLCGFSEGEHISLGEMMYSPVSGYEWFPRAIFNTSDISVGTVYAQLVRVSKFIKKRMSGANKTDKAHYEMLLDTIEKGLGL